MGRVEAADVSGAVVRLGVGTRLLYDGEVAEVVELLCTASDNEVVLNVVRAARIVRIAVKELLTSDRVRVVSGPAGAILR